MSEHHKNDSQLVKLIIACGYQYQVIQNYFKNIPDLNIKIQYSVEEQPLGRGGAIKLAAKSLVDNQSPTLVMNGDILTDISLGNLLAEHERASASATIVTVPLHSPYGIVETDNQSNVTRFVEKPELPHWLNAGIYMINSELWSEFPEIGDHEKDLFPKLVESKQLKAYKYNGFWRTIDTAKDLFDLTSEIEKGLIGQQFAIFGS
jgi:NDP-sugar pyrophosphorylase family protein